MKRESCENQERTRRCNRLSVETDPFWGRRTLRQATMRLFRAWEGAASRMIRESEDLPE